MPNIPFPHLEFDDEDSEKRIECTCKLNIGRPFFGCSKIAKTIWCDVAGVGSISNSNKTQTAMCVLSSTEQQVKLKPLTLF